KFERDLAADAAKAAGAVGSVGTPYTAGDKEKEYDFAKLVKKDEAFLTGVESQAEEFIKKFTESNPDLAASIIKKSNNEDERGGRSKATFLMEEAQNLAQNLPQSDKAFNELFTEYS